ncbi:hypothetical protein [Cyclobacterium amurskyense]|jgi:hypothetical protein|uniref:Uncharacterized protein n=1 Tax=Cyclobacterium amurskyense TaxID=320787 RepID=A0A0H4PEY8_9BACT|nr:hypothetical protein [Cyclobacterium amurskyense]AKP51373.1 hypothetical protein CA2015_1946 [Cyclobacterium amurskyense]|tara:strand:+ start:50416 stop:50607 length:192 start_codon:yes stop_codon:yes gene_type:complete
MMEYVKTILVKVSFDGKLFEKELRKGLNMLVPGELEEFRKWCYGTFSKAYEPILNKYFILLAG